VRDSVGAGKGDDRRPRLVTREEETLRWRLAYEMLSCEEKFDIEQRIKVLVYLRSSHDKTT